MRGKNIWRLTLIIAFSVMLINLLSILHSRVEAKSAFTNAAQSQIMTQIKTV